MAFVMDTQAQSLLALMQSNKDADAKTAEVQKIKAQIKHSAVQSEAIPLLFDAVKLGLASTNYTLFSASFSCVGHLIKRVTLQEPTRIKAQCNSILPIFIDRLGDQKGRISAQAVTVLVDMYKACPVETEKAIKELAMVAKSPKVREQSLQWMVQVYRNVQGFSFRSYTPLLMKLLEDADPSVRDLAKEAVVEMFKNAPGNAKADLKKELVKCGVRKAIATYIISGLGIPGGADVEKPAEEESLAVPKTASGTTASASASVASSNFIASLPGSDLETLEPDYVNTYKELEEIFQAMSPPFEGRESEGNWLAREKNCTKVRKLLRGNAYKEFQQTFLAGVKALLGGFLKAVNSLRTTLSTNGCQLVKDLAIICGPGLDPFVDILLTNTIKVCANTKKITAQMGNVTTSIILANVSYHPKILQHIWGACQDKNVQPRTFATGWLSLMLDTHIESKGYLEHTGGLEVLEKCMKRGLADANPGVREGMRKTFWKFASIWPDRGDVLISGLDASSKKLLEKVNPNAAAPAAKGPSSIRNPTLTRTATAPMARSSVKDAIMAQKRQLKLQRTETLPPEATVVPPAPPSGLSSAPVRPQRPKIKAPPPEPAPLQRAQTSMQLSVSANRAVSPSTSHSSTKETPHFSRRSPAPSSPPQTLRVVGRTPMRQQVPQVAARKLSLLDQLNHQDWRIRVEGIVIVACILAKKTPPNYDRSSKMPSLPPSDALAATLQRLLNDPQPEVVEHVVAPEVLSELVKVVPMEQIVTKVLLLSEGDDEDHSQPIMQSSMPALKGLMTQGETTDCLFRILTSMGAFGTVPKRLASTGSYTTTQKKKIIHGCLIWLAELIELALEGNENMYLEDRANYKTHASRLIQMCSSTKPPNYMPLATALKKFRKLDQLAFDKILATFEMSLVRDLRRAWGQPVEEEGFVEEEEKVAHVQEVLGMVPVLQKISPTPMSPRSRKRDFSPSENVRDQMRSMSASRDQMRSMSASLPPVPVTPPRRVMSMASEDKENKADAIPKLPELPVSRDGAASPASAKNGSAKVYQDAAVVDSNGAVATTTEKQPQQENGEWYRTKMRKQLSNSNLPKSPENTARLLQTLVKRLKARDIDTQALRKLMAIARENPVREVLKENNTEGGGPGVDIWAGGRMFDELLTTLLGFLDDEELDSDKSADLRVQGLLVLKQLLWKTAPYLTPHEGSVLITLLNLRGKYPNQSHVTTGVEEICEEFLTLVDPISSIEAILTIVLPNPTEANPNPPQPPTSSWCMGLKCLAVLIKHAEWEGLEKGLGRLGKLALRSLDASDAEVRKSAVGMCVEMNARVGDEEVLFERVLRGVNGGQMNLLMYYFAKRGKGA